jgi:hypothetical protein
MHKAGCAWGLINNNLKFKATLLWRDAYTATRIWWRNIAFFLMPLARLLYITALD